MKKIAVLCPIHRRPDLVLEQLTNYRYFSNDSCFHILHISKEGKDNFPETFIESVSSTYGTFTDESAGTSWKCVMGGFIKCSGVLEQLDTDFVYLHTDGDLLVKGNLTDYIYKNKLAYSGGFPEKSWNWPHYEKMMSDNLFKKMRDRLGIKENEILVGRQEGAFFPKDLWLKIISVVSEYYNDSFYDDVSLHWPLEEALVPTLARHFSMNSSKVRNIVKTKELMHSSNIGNQRDIDINCVSIDDVKNILIDDSSDCVGIKWFSQNIDDPARSLIREFY